MATNRKFYWYFTDYKFFPSKVTVFAKTRFWIGYIKIKNCGVDFNFLLYFKHDLSKFLNYQEVFFGQNLNILEIVFLDLIDSLAKLRRCQNSRKSRESTHSTHKVSFVHYILFLSYVLSVWPGWCCPARQTACPVKISAKYNHYMGQRHTI